MRHALLAGLAAILLFTSGGCPEPDPATPGADPTNATPTELRLVVLDDSALAEAINTLRGEWETQSGAGLTVEALDSTEWLAREDAPDSAGADIVILPSGLLGTLAERYPLAEIPESIRRDDPLWSDTFTLLRAHQAAWGTKTVGVPFGSAVHVCYYRVDLLEQLNAQPPETWKEYQTLARRLAEETEPAEPAQWHGALEPLGDGWAGTTLLARAAAYASHREHFSALFRISSMEPLIANAAFTRALDELVATAKAGNIDPTRMTPDDVRKAFWQGRCGLAITWPSASAEGLPSDSPFLVGIAPLPGSPDVYNYADTAWQQRTDSEDPRVPVLALTGRTGCVLANDSQPAAFSLLFWLTGPDWGERVASASPATTLFRNTQTRRTEPWVERPLVGAPAVRYAEVVAATLSRPRPLFIPRIPGRSEYLAALDRAVQQAVRGEATSAEALAEASGQWEKITDRLGRDAQRDAYRRSVGM